MFVVVPVLTLAPLLSLLMPVLLQNRNKECLSLGCNEVPLFWGRSPVDMYRDFMDAFANTFQHMFGSVIAEITVGLGPAGELRYPAYPEGDARCVCACGAEGQQQQQTCSWSLGRCSSSSSLVLGLALSVGSYECLGKRFQAIVHGDLSVDVGGDGCQGE